MPQQRGALLACISCCLSLNTPGCLKRGRSLSLLDDLLFSSYLLSVLPMHKNLVLLFVEATCTTFEEKISR